MMKLIRPYIPIKTRCEVAARQLQQCAKLKEVLLVCADDLTMKERLTVMLWGLFGFERYHLDHDPPLCLRVIVDAEKGIYDPPANDPEYLIYRTTEEHRLKTFVRGDGAQLSDAGKRRKEIKRKRNMTSAEIDAQIQGSDLYSPAVKKVAKQFSETLRRRRWPPKGSRPLRGRPF